MIWFIALPLQLLSMVLCWLTNWFVVLFANEEGELPGIFKLWQTWDDSLDSRYMMLEVVPKKYPFLDYDWNSKYEWYVDRPIELAIVGRERERVKLRKGATFNRKERVQRYFCRVLWLMRNCGYGFAFWCFGRTGNVHDLIFVKKELGEEEFVFAYDKNGTWLTKAWTLRWYKKTGFFWSTGYLGWKIPYWNNRMYRAMLANRVAIRMHPKED